MSRLRPCDIGGEEKKPTRLNRQEKGGMKITVVTENRTQPGDKSRGEKRLYYPRRRGEKGRTLPPTRWWRRKSNRASCLGLKRMGEGIPPPGRSEGKGSANSRTWRPVDVNAGRKKVVSQRHYQKEKKEGGGGKKPVPTATSKKKRRPQREGKGYSLLRKQSLRIKDKKDEGG